MAFETRSEVSGKLRSIHSQKRQGPRIMKVINRMTAEELRELARHHRSMIANLQQQLRKALEAIEAMQKTEKNPS